MKIGVAIGTNDQRFVPKLLQYQKEGLFDYIELYILWNVKVKDIVFWKTSGLNIEYIHAPHGERANFIIEYLLIAKECLSILNNKKIRGIVFDPGISKKDYRILDGNKFFPENMSYKTGFGDKGYLVLPKEMPKNFIFDFAHAYITAQQLNKNPYELIQQFMDKNPEHYHLTDTKDCIDHLLLGVGEMDIKYIKNMLPKNACITVETNNIYKHRIESIYQDLEYFKKI